MTPELAKLEVAVALYRDRKVSMGRAAELAGMLLPGSDRCSKENSASAA